MTLTIKLDGNWSSFQLANSTPPLSVTDSAIAPSARMLGKTSFFKKFKQFDKEKGPMQRRPGTYPSLAMRSAFDIEIFLGAHTHRNC